MFFFPWNTRFRSTRLGTTMDLFDNGQTERTKRLPELVVGATEDLARLYSQYARF